ncbi:MAG: HAD family hydrolase [archaeon]|jgi:putative hydrolase of the HAD superfamily
MIKLVVFDLWQTLIPATLDFVHLASLLKQEKLSLTEFIPRYERATQLKKYKKFEDLRKDFFEEFKEYDNELLEQELYEIYFNRIDHIRFYPEAKQTLIKLRKDGYKIALLSNTESLMTKVVEEKLNLSKLFDLVVLSYETGAIKPDKQAFDYVLKKMKTNPTEALMVGDSLRSDIIGSKNAGMHNCLINRLGKVIDNAKAKPEFTIKSLDEVSYVLGVLNAK